MTAGARSPTARGARSSRASPRARRPSASSPRGCRSPGPRSPSTSRCSRTPGSSASGPAGTRRIYRLNPTAVAALRDQLDTFWQRALAGYADVAEQSDGGELMTADPRPPSSAGRWSSTRRSSRRSPCSPSRFGDFKPPEHNLLARRPSPRRCSSPTSAATSTTAPSTAANAGGRGSWPTNRRTGWCSAGTSARTGRSRPTPSSPARSRSGSWPRARTAPGSNWSTATSTGTAPAGSRVADGVDSDDGWPLYLARFEALLQSDRP